MNLMDIRLCFMEARVRTGRNGFAVIYTPRSGLKYRNTVLINDRINTFRDIAFASESCRLILNKSSGFGFEFLFNGNELDVLEEYDELTKPKTWNDIKRNPAERNEIQEYIAKSIMSGVNAGDLNDIFARTNALIDRTFDMTGTECTDGNKIELLKNNVKALGNYIPMEDIDEFENTVEVSIMKELEHDTVISGLPMKIFQNILAMSSEINMEYSIGEDDVFATLMFII